MKPKVLYRKDTGKITSAGLTEFTATQEEDILELDNEMPADITNTHLVDDGELREMTSEELEADREEKINDSKHIKNLPSLIHATVLVLLDEINALRVVASLTPLTEDYIILAVIDKLS